MKKHHIGILSMIVCTIFTAIGQIFYKLASNNMDSLLSIVLNPFLILGLSCYALGLIFLMIAFKNGEVSVMYPILALSYVWVSLFSPIIFTSDSMSLTNWFGILLLVIGVSFIGAKK